MYLEAYLKKELGIEEIMGTFRYNHDDTCKTILEEYLESGRLFVSNTELEAVNKMIEGFQVLNKKYFKPKAKYIEIIPQLVIE